MRLMKRVWVFYAMSCIAAVSAAFGDTGCLTNNTPYTLSLSNWSVDHGDGTSNFPNKLLRGKTKCFEFKVQSLKKDVRNVAAGAVRDAKDVATGAVKDVKDDVETGSVQNIAAGAAQGLEDAEEIQDIEATATGVAAVASVKAERTVLKQGHKLGQGLGVDINVGPYLLGHVKFYNPAVGKFEVHHSQPNNCVADQTYIKRSGNSANINCHSNACVPSCLSAHATIVNNTDRLLTTTSKSISSNAGIPARATVSQRLIVAGDADGLTYSKNLKYYIGDKNDQNSCTFTIRVKTFGPATSVTAVNATSSGTAKCTAQKTSSSNVNLTVTPAKYLVTIKNGTNRLLKATILAGTGNISGHQNQSNLLSGMPATLHVGFSYPTPVTIKYSYDQSNYCTVTINPGGTGTANPTGNILCGSPPSGSQSTFSADDDPTVTIMEKKHAFASIPKKYLVSIKNKSPGLLTATILTGADNISGQGQSNLPPGALSTSHIEFLSSTPVTIKYSAADQRSYCIVTINPDGTGTASPAGNMLCGSSPSGSQNTFSAVGSGAVVVITTVGREG